MDIDEIHQKIIQHFQNNDESLLTNAKDIFSKLIKSKRHLEKVEAIEELLEFLQRRGLYSPVEMTAISIFQKMIFDEEFLALAKSYRAPDNEPENCYGNVRK